MKSTELFSIPPSPPPSIVVQWAERESYRRRNGIYRLHLWLSTNQPYSPSQNEVEKTNEIKQQQEASSKTNSSKQILFVSRLIANVSMITASPCWFVFLSLRRTLVLCVLLFCCHVEMFSGLPTSIVRVVLFVFFRRSCRAGEPWVISVDIWRHRLIRRCQSKHHQFSSLRNIFSRPEVSYPCKSISSFGANANEPHPFCCFCFVLFSRAFL